MVNLLVLQKGHQDMEKIDLEKNTTEEVGPSTMKNEDPVIPGNPSLFPVFCTGIKGSMFGKELGRKFWFALFCGWLQQFWTGLDLLKESNPSLAIQKLSSGFWFAFCCYFLRMLWMSLEFGIALYMLFVARDEKSCSPIPLWSESAYNVGLISICFWFFGLARHHFVTFYLFHVALQRNYARSIFFFVFGFLRWGLIVFFLVRVYLGIIALEPELKDHLYQYNAIFPYYFQILRQNLFWMLLYVFLPYGLFFCFLQIIVPKLKHSCALAFIVQMLLYSVGFAAFWSIPLSDPTNALFAVKENQLLCTPFVEITSRFVYWMYISSPMIYVFLFERKPNILYDPYLSTPCSSTSSSETPKE